MTPLYLALLWIPKRPVVQLYSKAVINDWIFHWFYSYHITKHFKVLSHIFWQVHARHCYFLHFEYQNFFLSIIFEILQHRIFKIKLLYEYILTSFVFLGSFVTDLGKHSFLGWGAPASSRHDAWPSARPQTLAASLHMGYFLFDTIQVFG